VFAETEQPGEDRFKNLVKVSPPQENLTRQSESQKEREEQNFTADYTKKRTYHEITKRSLEIKIIRPSCPSYYYTNFHVASDGIATEEDSPQRRGVCRDKNLLLKNLPNSENSEPAW
jgi:hypothetical protein